MTKNTLYVKEGRKRANLPFDSILFIEKYGAKAIIHTAEKEYRMYVTFRSLLNELDPRFFCPHESFIFNLDHIFEIDEEEVKIGRCHQVKMGEKCMRRLRKKMDENACKY